MTGGESIDGLTFGFCWQESVQTGANFMEQTLKNQVGKTGANNGGTYRAFHHR